MTKDAARILSEYKTYRKAAKVPEDLDAALYSFLRDVYKDALSRCKVRVIHGKRELMREEPSGALGAFLCRNFAKTRLNSLYGEVHHADQV